MVGFYSIVIVIVVIVIIVISTTTTTTSSNPIKISFCQSIISYIFSYSFAEFLSAVV
jgi:hypothetical protein